jgi:FkbM family methyltransferase
MKASTRLDRIARRVAFRTLHRWRRPHLITANVCGLRLQISSASAIAEGVYSNAFERLQRGLLDRLVQPGAAVIDVGANVGFYTCLFAQRVGPNGSVAAIEPTPETFRRLLENVRANGLAERVQCLQVAVADRPGTCDLHLFPEGDDVFNSLTCKTVHGRKSTGKTVPVKTVTLDQLVAPVDESQDVFVKVDVEGFEHEVLAGGRAALAREKLSLMVEISGRARRSDGKHPAEAVAMVQKYGFAAYCIDVNKQLAAVQEADLAALGETDGSLDVFFVRQRSGAEGRLRAA